MIPFKYPQNTIVLNKLKSDYLSAYNDLDNMQ